MAEGKWSSMQWKHTSLPSPKKGASSAHKVMPCFLGHVLEDFEPQGHTVNANYYSSLLSDE